MLSTSTSDPAITMQNNTELQGLMYASDGGLHVKNSIELAEATAYKLLLENQATVMYESGLANLNFTSGPSGGWDYNAWTEIE